MRAFVFDANVMNLYQQERTATGPDRAHLAMAAVEEHGYLVLDADGHCQQERLDCAGGTHPFALADWIADMMIRDRIRLVNYSCDSMFKELAGMGLPKKDHKWVRVARSGQSDNIVTEDIDLFDPEQKGCSRERAEKIKCSGRGGLAKYLGKRYGIRVKCLATFAELF